MHPEQIIKDFESMGARFVLESGNLYIEKHENAKSELVDFAKQYKSRIITYLQGDYSKKCHSVKSTIDKIVCYMIGEDHEASSKISNWLINDYEAVQQIITLMQKFYDNGWKKFDESIANYETAETDHLSVELFERAMAYFKGA